jgi:hypothetical protein
MSQNCPEAASWAEEGAADDNDEVDEDIGEEANEPMLDKLSGLKRAADVRLLSDDWRWFGLNIVELLVSSDDASGPEASDLFDLIGSIGGNCDREKELAVALSDRGLIKPEVNNDELSKCWAAAAAAVAAAAEAFVCIKGLDVRGDGAKDAIEVEGKEAAVPTAVIGVYAVAAAIGANGKRPEVFEGKLSDMCICVDDELGVKDETIACEDLSSNFRSCVRWCFFRWSLRPNFLQQKAQEKGRRPVWMRRCRVNSSLRVKVFPQFALSHTNGLSPEKKKKNCIEISNCVCVCV